jgi:PAS domain S-box-containing protein
MMVEGVAEQSMAPEERFRLAAIVESSEDAIVAKDLDGVIQTWNDGARRMFGYTEDEAIGQHITMIIPPDLHDEEAHILRRLGAGERIEHYETVRVSKDGRRIDVSLTISPIRDAEGRIIGASKIARDITEKKQAEAALRESEERFRLVTNTAPVMIWMSGLDKLSDYVNQPCSEFLGKPVEAIIGNGWMDCIHSDDVERAWDAYSKAFDRREPFQMEYRLRRHDGEYRWIIGSGVPRFDADGSIAGYIGTAIDVTERRQAEQALTTVNKKLIEGQEQERTRIARELHDDINQRLALLAIKLQRLERNLPRSRTELRQEIVEASKQVDDLSTDIQTLAHRLHSSRVELLGLSAAVAALCSEVSDRQKVKIEFRSENVPKDLSTERSICLFRVLQEALQNAIKHSGSRNLQVSLTGRTSEIELTVFDSGIGFDPAEAMKGRGLGLTSIRERLNLVNGTLSIESQPRSGTTIHARVPLNSEKS